MAITIFESLRLFYQKHKSWMRQLTFRKGAPLKEIFKLVKQAVKHKSEIIASNGFISDLVRLYAKN